MNVGVDTPQTDPVILPAADPAPTPAKVFGARLNDEPVMFQPAVAPGTNENA